MHPNQPPRLQHVVPAHRRRLPANDIRLAQEPPAAIPPPAPVPVIPRRVVAEERFVDPALEVHLLQHRLAAHAAMALPRHRHIDPLVRAPQVHVPLLVPYIALPAGAPRAHVPPPPVDPRMLQPSPVADPVAAEAVYEEVKKLLPDVNKEWVLQRAGYTPEILIDWIFENYDTVPMEQCAKENEHNLSASMLQEHDGSAIETSDDEERSSLIVDGLQKFIRCIPANASKESPKKILSYLRFKYTFIKVAVLNSLPPMGKRKLFAICTIIDLKKLTREMAEELNVSQLWKQGKPWMDRARVRDAVVLDGAYRVAHDEVENVVQASLDTVGKYDCCVCFDSFSIKRIVSCGGIDTSMIDEDAQDAHYVCYECMRGHANALCTDGKLAEGGSGLCCLDPGCDRVIPWARVSRILDRNVRHLLGKRIDNEALSTIEGLESCKRCSFAILFDVSVEENKVFKCEKCKAQFCRTCKYDWKDHMGRRCDEMKTVEDEKEANRKRLEEELANAIMRKCHKCKLVFAKDEGCNKMTCRCGATQCYVCRAANIGYDHFCNHVRDPRQPGCPVNCNGCLLWAKQDEVNKQAIEHVRQKALTDRNLHDLITKL